jgi:hypothetical protein
MINIKLGCDVYISKSARNKSQGEARRGEARRSLARDRNAFHPYCVCARRGKWGGVERKFDIMYFSDFGGPGIQEI